jgi:putative tricarboxylic transport membrane protein
MSEWQQAAPLFGRLLQAAAGLPVPFWTSAGFWPMTKVAQDRVIAIVVFILAGLMFLQAGRLPFEAGLFPRLVTAVMLLAAVAMFARSFVGSGRAEAEPLFINWQLLAITLVATVLYVIAVRTIGYFTSSLVFVPAIAYSLGLRKHRAIAVGTLLFVALIYLVFVRIFQLPMPREMLLERFI